jgi:lysine 2,3-aminomutase
MQPSWKRCRRKTPIRSATNGPALGKEQLQAAYEYIGRHPEIWEVIFTGGDPLVLPPRKLSEVVRKIGAIRHVKVLRWHTRMPVAKPEAITDELVASLKSPKTTAYLVLHVNHPRELTEELRVACTRIAKAGIPILSQSVLLKGVNDNVEVFEELMRKLVEIGVKPYYLHHMDLAPGTSHFRTSIEEGQRLMRELRARASGLCLPTYVLDIPGGYAKARLETADVMSSSAQHRAGETDYSVRDSADRMHLYPPKK